MRIKRIRARSVSVVASLHTSFRLSEKKQTDRMLRAMEHPLVDVIGHPTGRLIERRAPGLLRLSVGCEHVEDLWADLERRRHGAPGPGV